MRRDEGFVALAAAGLMLVLISIAAVVASLGAVAVARHRAATAADLAALAGARHLLEGRPAVCAAADRTARAQGGTLDSCTADGAEVLVIVSIRPTGRLGQLGAARARARAGTHEGSSTS